MIDSFTLDTTTLSCFLSIPPALQMQGYYVSFLRNIFIASFGMCIYAIKILSKKYYVPPGIWSAPKKSRLCLQNACGGPGIDHIFWAGGLLLIIRREWFSSFYRGGVVWYSTTLLWIVVVRMLSVLSAVQIWCFVEKLISLLSAVQIAAFASVNSIHSCCGPRIHYHAERSFL